MRADPPVQLPVPHLSYSSMQEFMRCPERWRRRRILGDYEPASSAMIVGGAVHAAEGESYQHRIDTGHIRTEAQVADVFSDEFDERAAHAPAGVDWEDEKPGRVKDHGIAVLRHYHRFVAPAVRPASVERAYSISFSGLAWTFEGYLDLETDDGQVADLKSRSPTKGIISPRDAAADLQVTANLFARRAEGREAPGFTFHNLVRAPKGKLTPAHVRLTPAYRTGAELDAFHELLMRVAAAIAWAAENDSWAPAPPGSWWCSERFCGFWPTCRFGGQHRSVMFTGEPHSARRLTDSVVREAALLTLRRDGTTTAERVARHLGITTRAAAARLRAQPAIHAERPTKASGRGKDKVLVALPGPAVYRPTPIEGEKAA